MESNNETSPNLDRIDPQPDAPAAQEVNPHVVTDSPKKTLTGFAKIWVIIWIVGNLGATCAPANRLTNSRLGGLVALVMLLSAVVAVGYVLLYYKKPVGIFMILTANILGILLNFIEVTGYSINVTTGLITGIITYFITRGQITYPFGKPFVTK